MQKRPSAAGVDADPPPLESRRRLAAAHLYLIVEAQPLGRAAAELLEPALAGGVDIVQLRDKDARDEEVVAAGRAFRELCDRHGALFILNDRPELVLECGADGVHLGQDDSAPDQARAMLGADALIGVSTHTREQVDAARASTADYVGVGPVHATPTKPGREAVGEDLVDYAARHAGKPFFAIGGIDPANVETVVAAGARRVAVVRAIRDADDPRAAARALRAAVSIEAGRGPAR